MNKPISAWLLTALGGLLVIVDSIFIIWLVLEGSDDAWSLLRVTGIPLVVISLALLLFGIRLLSVNGIHPQLLDRILIIFGAISTLIFLTILVVTAPRLSDDINFVFINLGCSSPLLIFGALALFFGIRDLVRKRKTSPGVDTDRK